jgi:hypothetical protein
MAVTLFTGKPGSGKSYRVVLKLLEDCEKYYIFHNVDGLNHDFFCDGKFIKRWDDIPGFLTLEKQKEVCSYIQDKYDRPVLVVVDEAYINGFGVRNAPILNWIAYHRHLGQDIYLVTHNVRDIHIDFVNRCQFEIRAKRGIATQQFVYQYLVGDESFKTDRVPTKKAVFAAYKSFESAGHKPPRSKILVYGVVLLCFAVLSGVYQVCFGLPRLFGKGGGIVQVPHKELIKKTDVPVVPSPVPEKAKKVYKGPSIDKEYCYAGFAGKTIFVQSSKGGHLYSLNDVYPGYMPIEVSDRCVVVRCDGTIHKLCRGKVNVPKSETQKVDDEDMGFEAVPGSGVRHVQK